MRKIPAHRFTDLIAGATKVFVERGYRQTQMSDVAEVVGVAKGTIYGYVESKEALFLLCLRWADRANSIQRPKTLPVPTPPAGALKALLEPRLSESAVGTRLATALEVRRAPNPRVELEEVLRELYDVMESNRRGIKLLDRCIDHPELGGIWQEAGRESSRAAMRRYIEMRIHAGQFRPAPNARLAARMVIEVIATWAVHIYWDRVPEDLDSDEARENAIDFLMRGLLP